MLELADLQRIPESSRPYYFKVELHGGEATFYNLLSTGQPEAVKVFDGSESAIDRRFKHEIVEGEDWYFGLTGGAKVLYR